MKRQHKILFGARRLLDRSGLRRQAQERAPKDIRRVFCRPRPERAVMDWLVPRPPGYTGI